MTPEEKQDARAAEVVTDAPESTRNILRRAFEGEASALEAIKAQCLICVGYQREDIANCTGYSCPLWQYRPYAETVVTARRRAAYSPPQNVHGEPPCGHETPPDSTIGIEDIP